MMLAKNRKAYFNYQILEKMEAGMQLLGHEVKAVRQGKISLDGSFVTIRDGEVFLLGCDIAPYQPKNTPKDYSARRDKKLLLNKKEIKKLIGKIEERGVSIVPLKIYNKKGILKLEIALAKGKKKWDKREAIKRRDVDRKIREIVK